MGGLGQNQTLKWCSVSVWAAASQAGHSPVTAPPPPLPHTHTHTDVL